MILLDTNVVSEAMKPGPNQSVAAWLDMQVAETLFLSSVSLAELMFGIQTLPDGRRKTGLAYALDELLKLYHGRVLLFDAEAARHYAALAARAREAGKRLPIADGYIAAIAATAGFIVATRDIAPFEAAGVSIVNPWTEEPLLHR